MVSELEDVMNITNIALLQEAIEVHRCQKLKVSVGYHPLVRFFQVLYALNPPTNWGAKSLLKSLFKGIDLRAIRLSHPAET